MNEMPTIDARKRHNVHGKGGKFAKRPETAVTPLPTPPIGRMPRTPGGLSDDAFSASAMQEAARIQRAMSTDMPTPPTVDHLANAIASLDRARVLIDELAAMTAEPIEREAWFSWRDWELRDLWVVAFVGTVLAFAGHVAGLWG